METKNRKYRCRNCGHEQGFVTNSHEEQIAYCSFCSMKPEYGDPATKFIFSGQLLRPFDFVTNDFYASGNGKQLLVETEKHREGNRVFENGIELTDSELFERMCAMNPFLEDLIDYTEIPLFIESRLEGTLCKCNGHGTFEMMPMDDESVATGGKCYMQCTKCNCYSHL